MRYFTKELWSGAQEVDDSDENDRLWKLASETYISQLESFKDRLEDDVYSFFREARIHDGQLDTFSVSDGNHADYRSDPPILNPHPVSVSSTIRSSDGTTTWVLNYSKIKCISLDFPSSEPLFHSDGEGFNDIGYHELTDLGQGFYRHEILFSSGSTILVEFQHISVTSRSA